MAVTRNCAKRLNTIMNESQKTPPRRPEKSRAAKRTRSGSATQINTQANEQFNAVIMDSGGYSIKVGYASVNKPKIIPNCIMKAKSERKRLFIGDQISECRDCSGLYYLLPCERGYITKWDVQKPIWDYTFSKNVCPINDLPVIMTQPVFNFKSIQECMDELFFEEYEVSSMFRANPTDFTRLQYISDHDLPEDIPIIFVDTGYSFTHVVPYINGNKYLPAVKRINVGGKLLTNHLKDIISYRQYNVMEETYVINQVKEDACYVADNAIDEIKISAKTGKENDIVKNYVLPDFNNIRRGYIQKRDTPDEAAENCQILRLNNERFLVPEILFHPSDIGMKSMGIAEAVIKSINLCPPKYRRSLSENIVIMGGNCMFRGFKERLFSELRSRLPDTWKVLIHMPEDPITYAWYSHNALLKHPNLKNLLVTKKDYEELGSSQIQKRFNYWNNCVVEEEEPPKPVVVYSILDNIKGKSIFGKEDPYEVPVTNNPFRKPPSEDSPEAQSVPGTSESTPMDTQPDSDDSILMAGKEHLFQKKLKVHLIRHNLEELQKAYSLSLKQT
ncbi:actin-related protein 6 isoform X2 [Aethina tumida]|uniref:actin-related protein 6 isoform X2 n=1 Tax=Aethina tumida TaxID=116153 RepID=UPI002148C440|nr:actin-related protein 6 isoform X2 [Aethina tumida]